MIRNAIPPEIKVTVHSTVTGKLYENEPNDYT